jgi:hypothetical protein
MLQRLPMSARGHCALWRANRVFCADEKRIRTENTVLVNSKHSADGFSSTQRYESATSAGTP